MQRNPPLLTAVPADPRRSTLLRALLPLTNMYIHPEQTPWATHQDVQLVQNEVCGRNGVAEMVGEDICTDR